METQETKADLVNRYHNYAKRRIAAHLPHSSFKNWTVDRAEGLTDPNEEEPYDAFDKTNYQP